MSLGKTLHAISHFGAKQSIYPLWRPSLAKDVWTESFYVGVVRHGAYVWFKRRRNEILCHVIFLIIATWMLKQGRAESRTRFNFNDAKLTQKSYVWELAKPVAKWRYPVLLGKRKYFISPIRKNCWIFMKWITVSTSQQKQSNWYC